MMDGGVDIDIEEIKQNIDEAEVATLYFPLFRKTLLIDTRCSEHVGPAVRVVPMASSSVDRLRSIRRIRPELPRPESLTMIPWARRVDSLVRLGVWDRVMRRLQETGDPTVCRAAEECYCELRELELREFACAITGSQYQTIWPRREVEAE